MLRCCSSNNYYLLLLLVSTCGFISYRPKKTWTEIVEKDCKALGLNREDAMDRSRWRKQIGYLMTAMGVSGWMFLLVPAHPGCPGQNPKSHKTVVCMYVCMYVSDTKTDVIYFTQIKCYWSKISFRILAMQYMRSVLWHYWLSDSKVIGLVKKSVPLISKGVFSRTSCGRKTGVTSYPGDKMEIKPWFSDSQSCMLLKSSN